jgi:hypothetical protein
MPVSTRCGKSFRVEASAQCTSSICTRTGRSAAAATKRRVLEDHRVAGQTDHILRVIARSLGDLEPFVDELNNNGRPMTSLVFSSPKRWSPVPSLGEARPR